MIHAWSEDNLLMMLNLFQCVRSLIKLGGRTASNIESTTSNIVPKSPWGPHGIQHRKQQSRSKHKTGGAVSRRSISAGKLVPKSRRNGANMEPRWQLKSIIIALQLERCEVRCWVNFGSQASPKTCRCKGIRKVYVLLVWKGKHNNVTRNVL